MMQMISFEHIFSFLMAFDHYHEVGSGFHAGNDGDMSAHLDIQAYSYRQGQTDSV